VCLALPRSGTPLINLKHNKLGKVLRRMLKTATHFRDILLHLARFELVHGDLSDGNVLFCPQRKSVIVVDFGVARSHCELRHGERGGSQGSYGMDTITAKRDVWSCAALLLRLWDWNPGNSRIDSIDKMRFMKSNIVTHGIKALKKRIMICRATSKSNCDTASDGRLLKSIEDWNSIVNGAIRQLNCYEIFKMAPPNKFTKSSLVPNVFGTPQSYLHYNPNRPLRSALGTRQMVTRDIYVCKCHPCCYNTRSFIDNKVLYNRDVVDTINIY